MTSIIGSWGWRHSEWKKDVFYPDDLPEEWQLAYYSNEFDVAVVPASYWAVDGYGEDDWLDDVTDEFMFYIDWPFQQLADQADYEKCAQYCQQLDQQLVAVLLNGDVWQTLSNEQQQWFKTATANFTVQQYNAVTETEYVPVSNDKEQIVGENVLLLHSDTTESLRDLGGRLGQLLANENQPTKIEYIILSNEKVKIDRLKELDTLVTLIKG